MSLGLEGLLGLKMLGFGPSGPGKDNLYLGTGMINKSDKGEEGKGKTNLTSIKGDRDATRGSETYIDIKGPTLVGTRSSIGRTNEVLSAKKKAEQAIDRQKIPKEHEKRVREYFRSLTGG